MSERIEIHGVSLDKFRTLRVCADEARFAELSPLLRKFGEAKLAEQAQDFLRAWMFTEAACDVEGEPHLLLFLSLMEHHDELDLSL